MALILKNSVGGSAGLSKQRFGTTKAIEPQAVAPAAVAPATLSVSQGTVDGLKYTADKALDFASRVGSALTVDAIRRRSQ